MKSEYVYGPVPSRRLGLSLGIDIIPFKHCTFNCRYCQLGATTVQTLQRKEYTPFDDITAELVRAVTNVSQFDYVTFSGSGEPTLHSRLDDLILFAKQCCPAPVAVLTNSSLLYRDDVQNDLMAADVVVPTLSTVDPVTFKKIHCPHDEVTVDMVLNGLVNFRANYKGEIWLEIMLVSGINNTTKELERLHAAVEQIKPDRIHLNTVIRPPRDLRTTPLSKEEMDSASHIIAHQCEIIAEFKTEKEPAHFPHTQSIVLNMIRRRPVTVDDIEHSLGISRHELAKHIQALLKANRIRENPHEGKVYYEATERRKK